MHDDCVKRDELVRQLRAAKRDDEACRTARSLLDSLADRLDRPAPSEGKGDMPTREDWLYMASERWRMNAGGPCLPRFDAFARAMADGTMVAHETNRACVCADTVFAATVAERDAAIARAEKAEALLREIEVKSRRYADFVNASYALSSIHALAASAEAKP